MSPIERSGGGSGGGSGAWTLLSSATLGAPAATIDLTGIPGTFNHLYVTFQVRGDNPSLEVNTNFRFNGDSGNNYNDENLFGGGAAVGASPVSATSHGEATNAPAATATASSFGTGNIFVPFYAGTAALKTAISQGGRVSTIGTVGTYVIEYWFSQWNNTNAINRVTIFPSAGNWAAGSAVTLHGIL